MSNLVKHAKSELKIIGAFDKKKDFYGGMTGNAVLELIELFAKQGHSGMSASIVRNLFNNLANYGILSPLKCNNDEWTEYAKGKFQNKRFSSVFKDRKNGVPHYIDAIIWKEKNGSCFTGRVEEITSSQKIKIPFIPKKFYVDVITVNDEHKIKDRNQLKEIFKYYRR